MIDLDALPRPAARRLAIRVRPDVERHLRQGHPWLFDRGIISLSHEGQPGDLGVIFDQRRRFLAIGLYDPTSPLRLRVLHRGEAQTIDQGWFRQRLALAIGHRHPLIADPQQGGFRLVHGENDGLPGLVVDSYAEVLVLRLDSVAWVPHLATLLPLLVELLAPAAMVLRLSRQVGAQREHLHGLEDGHLLAGALPPPPLLFQENGFLMEVDPVRGQKTGYFLDQRENRAYVERLAVGRDMLDLFAYQGGFSLHAARGGAAALVAVDQSAAALAVARRNFQRNEAQTGRPASTYETREGDAFQQLEELAGSGRQFGLVVLDPPSFARRQAEVAGARHAYRRLVRAALAVLAAGGILAAASCSSRLPAADYFALVEATAREARGDFQRLHLSEHPLDHPIGFPEGAYLKCIVLRL